MSIAPPFPRDFIETLESIAICAGLAILSARDTGISHSTKADGSPVTNADLIADAIIHEGLQRLASDIPIISEETWTPKSDLAIRHRPQYWCVDPLDGTRGFLAGGKHFTVNIALIQATSPVLGVIYAPALNLMWGGDTTTKTAWRRETKDAGKDAGTASGITSNTAPGIAPDMARLMATTSPSSLTSSDFPPIAHLATPPHPIQTRPVPVDAPKVITTLWHKPGHKSGHKSGQKRHPILDDWLKRIKPAHATSIGSSIKFCHLAEGQADLYARIRETMEWDTAAGQAILESAGGLVWDATAKPLGYGKPDRYNGSFLAMGGIAHVPAHVTRQWLPIASPSL